jgi:SPP1 family predicted phage head-tail adaptor
MSAGELDRRITIQRATLTRNDFNELIETWTDYVTISAKCSDPSTAEKFRAQEVGAEIDMRFTIRWSLDVSDVSPRDRVRFDDREYNITGVRNIGRRRWREIVAVARAEGMVVP